MRNVAFLGILMHLFKKNITSMSGMLLNVCAKHVPVWGKRGHGRAITGTKIILTCPLFESRTESYFDTTITSIGVVLSISEVLVKYDLHALCFLVVDCSHIDLGFMVHLKRLLCVMWHF